MKIELRKVRIRELVADYVDDREGGVRGYSGKLDIRPRFQREFVYKDRQRDAVIDTIMKGFPLNVMYWADRGNGTYEIIDGQQRTISIAQYVTGDFSFNKLFFHNQPDDIQENILDYELMIYVCEGPESEKLEWFKIVNIAGERLYDQEIRNAVYSGSWVSDAKKHFSRSRCAAYGIGQDYMKGTPIRQDYLETVIDWISEGNIEDYMGKHQHNSDAKELWKYFRDVVGWIEDNFELRKKIMRGVDWGTLYNQFKEAELDPRLIEEETAKLIADDDVQRKQGIYPYILTGEEKHLNIRAFSDSIKQKVYDKQSGICKFCGEHFDIKNMEADHITPWVEGGKTVEENCQMLCKKDNRSKSSN